MAAHGAYPPYTPPQPIYYAPPPPPPAPPPRAERSTSTTGRIETRRPSSVALAIILPLIGLGIVGAAVHVAVVPLDVLAVWRQPARLSVRSDPSGAEVWLDGRRLSARTPAHTEVERDRIPHTIEVRHPGHANETTTLRFDRTVKLEVSLKMTPAPEPAPAEAAPPPPAVPAPSVTPTPTSEATPAKPAHKGKASKGKSKRSGKGKSSARARPPR
jgi:hypothetical protein